MVDIALGIILALVILVALFVVAAFFTGIYQAARDEVNDEGFGQRVLDGIIFLIKSPINYFRYVAPILALFMTMWAATLIGETASFIVYLGGLVVVAFYYAYLREQKKVKKSDNN